MENFNQNATDQIRVVNHGRDICPETKEHADAEQGDLLSYSTYPNINCRQSNVAGLLLNGRELKLPVVLTSTRLVHLKLVIADDDEVTSLTNISYPPNLRSLVISFRGEKLQISNLPSTIETLELCFGEYTKPVVLPISPNITKFVLTRPILTDTNPKDPKLQELNLEDFCQCPPIKLRDFLPKLQEISIGYSFS
jgi:hypothetical protein